jgi:hypothetical protein
MAELLFGSGPQIWPVIPMSNFGQLPSFATNRGATIVPATPSDPAQSMNAIWQATPVTSIGVPNAATAITPQMLLTTVAVRRGQPNGPTNDQDMEDFIYDALELLPGSNDVEVRCENGRVTLTGTAPHKRLKRDAGEVVWAIPSVNDVQNNITIATRRRSRTQGREMEGAAPGGRKPA